MSNITVDYDVLNQKGTPAWFSDVYANLPTFGFEGRMFVSTDTFEFYRDTGTAWDLIGGAGIGGITGSGVSGRVPFFNGTSSITSSANLLFNSTTSLLTITGDINVNSITTFTQFAMYPTSGSSHFYITPGTSVNTPYISILNPSGNRIGIFGFSATNIALGLENSAAFEITGGNVLIGTSTNSGFKLDVVGTLRTSGAVTFSSTLGVGAITCAGINTSDSIIFTNTAKNITWQGANTYTIRIVTSGTEFQIYRGDTGATPLILTTGDVLRIANLGGSGTRAVLADASGNLSAPVSDISVKENILNIGYGLNEIVKMKPVWFDFIDEYKNYGEGRQNGNIAQDMEAIIPEAVFVTPSTGKKGINYDQLHAVYIKAIQELNEKLIRNNIN